MALVDCDYGSSSDSEEDSSHPLNDNALTTTGQNQALIAAPAPVPATANPDSTPGRLPSSATITPTGAGPGPPRTILPSAAALFSGATPGATTSISSTFPVGLGPSMVGGGGHQKRPHASSSLNGSATLPGPVPKVARGQVASSDAATPGTASWTDVTQLVPPQLSGRRNVATEDLDKLFVRKTRH